MLNYEYPPLGGGASPVTKSLAEELVKLGHTVDVVTMGFKGLKRKEEINGVTIYRVPSIRKEQGVCQTHEMLSYCYSACRFLPKLLKENKYDINHTHFIIPTGIVSYLNRKKLPYIITSHGSDVPGHNPDRFSFQHELLKPVWRQVVKNAEWVIAPSNYLKNIILKNVDVDNAIVIPNGFDISSFNFNLKKKEMKILLVSRLFEFKGFQYFLDAIKDLDTDYEINIVGEGPYKEALEKKTKLVKADVNFLGWLDNKSPEYKELYETSSIFVFPSAAESFGIVLLEAMASGCAIITTNTSGCSEVVGDAALLVRPKNPEDIRNVLTKLRNNERLISELGIKAKKRVEENFTLEKIAKKYVKVYEDILENNSLNSNMYDDLFLKNINKRVEYGDINASFDFFMEQNFDKKIKILEIGCNVGSLSNKIYHTGYRNIVGVDIAKSAVEYGKNEYPEITDKFIVCEGNKLPFRNNSFDVVLSFDVFEHIPNSNKHLLEVRRVLIKNKGYYLFQTPNKIINIPWEILQSKKLFEWRRYHCSLQTYSSLKSILILNGFCNIEIFKRDIITKYNKSKVQGKLGKMGLLLINLLNKLPTQFSSNFWVSAKR